MLRQFPAAAGASGPAVVTGVRVGGARAGGWRECPLAAPARRAYALIMVTTGRVLVSELPQAVQDSVRQGESVVIESSGRAVARIVPSEAQRSEGIFAFAGRWTAPGRLGPNEIDEAIGQAVRR